MIIGTFVAGVVAYNYGQGQRQQQEQIQEQLNAIQQTEILSETQIEESTEGVGNSSNNTVSSQGNKIRLGQKIPQLYGYTRSFPDLIGDPYDFFDTAAGDVGEQTLYEYFVITEGEVTVDFNSSFDSNPRIGNLSVESLPNAQVDIFNPGDTFTYNDFIEHLEPNQGLDLIPNRAAGDLMGFGTFQVSGFIDINITGSSGTITIERQTRQIGDVDPLQYFSGIINGNYSPGDNFEIFSSTAGLSGTFVLDSLDLLSDTSVIADPREQCILQVSSAVGFINGTYTGLGVTAFFFNQDGKVAGDFDKLDNNLPVPTTGTSSGKITIPLNKRPQLDSADYTVQDFISLNILFPQGINITNSSNNDAIFEIQPIEVDANGNKLGDIGSVSVQTIRIPLNRTTITVEVEVPVVDGRYLGVEIERTDDEFAETLVYAPASFEQTRSSVVSRYDSSIVSAGIRTVRTNFFSDYTIVRLIRTALRGDNRQATGKFNLKPARVFELFDFNTGTFGAVGTPPDTVSWKQAFMYHAVIVGKIDIEDIDYEGIEEIDQQIQTETGEGSPSFNFTFSNKSNSLDQELSLIANSVRAIVYKEGSVYRLARDQERTKVGNITSRNLDSFEDSKSVAFSLPNPEDGIELEYIDSETDKIKTIYVPDDRTAVRPKRVTLSGVSNGDDAWRRAQYEFLKLFSQRVSRSITTTEEAKLWSLYDRVTVYDNTRLVIKPLSEQDGFFRQETECQKIELIDIDDEGTSTDDFIFGSERIEVDGTMAMELNLDLPDGTGLGVVQNVLILVDDRDTRRFRIDPSTNPTLRSDILAQMRQVDENGQIGEKILIYPVSITDNQLTQDDYLILSKVPEGDKINIELVEYNEDLYQFDDQSPP